MAQQRPVNLNLFTIRFPLPAVASILHRISGVVLFAGTALGLYLLQLSLESRSGFDSALTILSHPGIRFILWLLLGALGYHLIAGVRHLLLDFGIGESARGGTTGAALTLGIAALTMALAGVWLW